MTLTGWTSVTGDRQGTTDIFNYSTSTKITATGNDVDGYASYVSISFSQDVVDCYSYEINYVTSNDSTSEIFLGIKDLGDSDYTSISGTGTFKKSFGELFTGTITFYIYATTDGYTSSSYSGEITVNGSSLNYTCSPAFSADNVTPLVNEVVTFTNASLGSDLTYLWSISGTEDTDWEYSGTSTENSENPEVVFLTDGDFDVSLTVYVSEVECDTETKASYISALPIVTAQSMRKSFCIVVNNTSYRNVR